LQRPASPKAFLGNGGAETNVEAERFSIAALLRVPLLPRAVIRQLYVIYINIPPKKHEKQRANFGKKAEKPAKHLEN
jgi:hypothetical protein